MNESAAWLLVYAIGYFGSLLILWLIIASAVRSGVVSALRKDRWDVWRDQQKARDHRPEPNVKAKPPPAAAPLPVKPRKWPEPREVFTVVDDTPEDEP